MNDRELRSNGAVEERKRPLRHQMLLLMFQGGHYDLNSARITLPLCLQIIFVADTEDLQQECISYSDEVRYWFEEHNERKLLISASCEAKRTKSTNF